MNRKQTTSFLTALVWLLLVCFSCKKHSEDEYHSLNEKIEEESKHYKGTSVSSEAFIGDLKTIKITEGVHTFLIPERKSEITSFKCSECHRKPLLEIKGKEYKKAHWDIKILHANAEIMNCVTCHNGNDMDNLKSLTGSKIDFNLSYKLCSQCHNNQFEDWKGGAHGKNIGGWSLPRAANTCVNCHNPHNPKIASKWPVRYNTQTAKERK